MPLAEVSLDDKYAAESGRVYLTGLQALARLLIAQCRRDRASGLDTAGFVSGYQGSPLNHMDSVLRGAAKHLEPLNIHFQPGHNEELALTSVWGSQQVGLLPGAKYDGVFALWYAKWAGVARCGDAFHHGNSAGSARHGGVLVVCGDDHMARSSTVATQSEQMLLAPMLPVLVPAGVQDYLDLGLHGWAMSRFSGSWIGFKAVDDTIESSASVSVDPDRVNTVIPADFDMPAGGLNIRLPDQPLQMERRIHEYRLPAVQAYARANGIDRVILDAPRPRIGVIAAGKSYLDVRQALDHLGIGAREAAEIGLRLYKVGMTWPLEPHGLRAFAEGLEEILVVEEKRPLIETQVKELFYHLPDGRRPRVLGKQGAEAQADGWLLPPTGELSPELIATVLADRILRFHANERIAQAVEGLRARQEALARPSLSPQLQGYLGDAGRVPYYCSGCPHNTSTRVPDGSNAIAGVGCHFMASYIFPGSKIFSHMGAEGSVWIGQAPFTETRHIFANMGDGTYYHSGLLSIRAAIAAKVNMTFKILYNDATAATGGQGLPAPMSVPAVTLQLEAEGVKRIAVATDEPEKYAGGRNGLAPDVTLHHRDALDQLQRELRSVSGVSVIVYDQTCAAEKRRRRKRGTYPDPARRSFINTRVCEGCGDCNVKSNCVSILPLDTEFGRKRIIDQSSCNKDFSCIRGFCPSYVTVEGGAPRRGGTVATDATTFSDLPEPLLPALEERYGIVVAGIGGTGIITVGALLGMAAHLEGRGVSVLDMTGVAQKGGAVTTHVCLAPSPGEPGAIRIAAGDARAVIGCDLLVTCESGVLSRMRRGLTRAIVNTKRLPTVAFIRQPDLATPWTEMEHGLGEAVGEDALSLVDASGLTTALLGDSIYANVFLLGYAHQSGLVPLSTAAILRAIELNGADVERNKLAFAWGRLAAHDRTTVEHAANRASGGAEKMRPSHGLDEVIDRRIAFLTAYQNAAYARRYAGVVERVRAAEAAIPAASGRLTEAVARSLFKLMAYKDEYEVARLYTDGEFEREVEAAFEGDYRIRYHLAPPLLSRVDPEIGEPRKRSFGPWLRPFLKGLARLKGLRGTPFDLFGYTAERRLERELIAEYERTVERILDHLSVQSLETAISIAALPETIRGFGHVKQESIEAARHRQAELLEELRRGQRRDAKVA